MLAMIGIYPGQRGQRDEQYKENGRVEEELEVIGEVPGPGRAHLTLRPEVVDVQEIPPPELGTVGRILHRTERS